MLRLICKCGYDGQMCEKVVPRIDEAGYVVMPEKNKEWVLGKCVESASAIIVLERVLGVLI